MNNTQMRTFDILDLETNNMDRAVLYTNLIDADFWFPCWDGYHEAAMNLALLMEDVLNEIV